MPELPEVETVRRVLLPHLQNRKIITTHIANNQVTASPLPEEFAALIAGQTIDDICRRGKFLRILFIGGDYLTIHLRMTGCLTTELQTVPLEQHTPYFYLRRRQRTALRGRATPRQKVVYKAR